MMEFIMANADSTFILMFIIVIGLMLYISKLKDKQVISSIDTEKTKRVIGVLKYLFNATDLDERMTRVDIGKVCEIVIQAIDEMEAFSYGNDWNIAKEFAIELLKENGIEVSKGIIAIVDKVIEYHKEK